MSATARICSECGTLKTPKWRRCGDQTLCNKCGLLPSGSGNQMKEAVEEKVTDSFESKERTCAECGTWNTSKWRRLGGVSLCNKCGLRRPPGPPEPATKQAGGNDLRGGGRGVKRSVAAPTSDGQLTGKEHRRDPSTTPQENQADVPSVSTSTHVPTLSSRGIQKSVAASTLKSIATSTSNGAGKEHRRSPSTTSQGAQADIPSSSSFTHVPKLLSGVPELPGPSSFVGLFPEQDGSWTAWAKGRCSTGHASSMSALAGLETLMAALPSTRRSSCF